MAQKSIPPPPSGTIVDSPPSNIPPPPSGSIVNVRPAATITQGPSHLQLALQGAENLGKGAIKGLGHTLYDIGAPAGWAAQAMGLTHETPQQHEQQVQMFQPHGTMQQIGHGVEQAGEFLTPGLGEESLLKDVPEATPFLKPIARVGFNALASGAINKAQGGGFGTGAVAGAAAPVASMGLKAIAPTLVGIAQGLDSPYGKTGSAILNETSGVFPGQIRRSAQGVLDTLNPQLEEAANQSEAQIPMGSARQAANEQMGKTIRENNARMRAGVKRMGKQLFERKVEPPIGAEGPRGIIPIPDQVSAREYLDLKRGIGKALPAGSWSPESSNMFKGARNAIYGDMAKTFEQHVPEAGPLNRRISALIPATEKPNNFYFGHALGPGVGALLGGIHGYRSGIGPEGNDIPGGLAKAAEDAIAGGAAGFALPAALNATARTVWSPAFSRGIAPLIEGAALQATGRKKEKK